MSTTSLDRIAELWPDLSEAVRRELVTRAEAAASGAGIELSAEDIAGIERGREDFRQDRTLTHEEYRAGMDAFFARLKAKMTAK